MVVQRIVAGAKVRLRILTDIVQNQDDESKTAMTAVYFKAGRAWAFLAELDHVARVVLGVGYCEVTGNHEPRHFGLVDLETQLQVTLSSDVSLDLRDAPSTHSLYVGKSGGGGDDKKEERVDE
ncbi:hypothetical protein SCUP515_11184 [Seiridium cupressi]